MAPSQRKMRLAVESAQTEACATEHRQRSVLRIFLGAARHLFAMDVTSSFWPTHPHFTVLNSCVVVRQTLADFEINDIAALPPLLCYNSYLCFDSSACASERWFVSCAPIVASYSRIWRYVNNSPS